MGSIESQTHGADLARGITVSLGPVEFQKDMVLSDLICLKMIMDYYADTEMARCYRVRRKNLRSFCKFYIY